MKGAVTVIGAYNGVPAFEYEIRDDADVQLGMDIVVIHAHDNETWDDLAAFVEQFLRKRAMKWELSRVQRRETRLGGKRLAEYAASSTTAPRLSGTRVAAKHRVATTVTKAEADSWYTEATIPDAEVVADAN